MRWRFRAAAAALALFCVSGGSAAQSIPGYPESIGEFDPREVARLPPYCIYTAHFRENIPAGMNPVESRRWQALFGEVFQTLHHYCWGLMYLHRAKFLAREERIRRFNFGAAIHDFDYVLNFVEARKLYDFVLLPEILTRKGEALVGLGRGARAIAEFERAIELRPDYWPAYAQLADYYRDSGEVDRAREVLHAGLARSPDTPALTRRLKELDDTVARPGDRARPR
jgi:tetratricopeptide (TPR) repeat protein